MSIAKGQGPWVPLHTGLVRELPAARPFTKLEAMYSLQVDRHQGNTVTLRGCMKRWSWASVGKVERFFKEIGVKINYPEDTGRKKNQRGTIVCTKPEQSRDNRGTIKFIDSNYLPDDTGQERDNRETKPGQSRGATIKTSDFREKKEKPLSPEALRLSGLVADLILANTPKHTELTEAKREATVARWAGDIDKLNRIDGQSWEDIEEVIQWCQGDSFWRGNILSGATLRKQFNQLIARMTEENRRKRGSKANFDYLQGAI